MNRNSHTKLDVVKDLNITLDLKMQFSQHPNIKIKETY